MIRLGIVGCGAVVQHLHLPPLLAEARIEIAAVADLNVDMARDVAGKCGAAQIVSHYQDMKDIDAVLIATPHSLHAPMAEHFLGRGIHVLCEKPFVTNVADAEKLVRLQKEKGLALCVGVFRRYYPVSRLVRELVERKWFGPVRSVDLEEGGPYAWDLQSKFMMKREMAGGGVLIDAGAHAVDRLFWWFGLSKIDVVSYRDNSAEGIETDCECKISMHVDGATVPARIELSRTRTLRNSCIIEMETGSIEVQANSPYDASFTDKRLAAADETTTPIRIDAGDPMVSGKDDVTSYFAHQISDFCDAIEIPGHKAVIDAETVVPTVRFTEECYRRREALDEPWVDNATYDSLLGKAGLK